MGSVEQELLYQEEQGYVGLYYDRMLGYVMTVKLHQWSLSEYKRYLPIWKTILTNVKNRGIDVVYGLCETEENEKFTEVFGFVGTDKALLCDDGFTKRIMRLEL